MAGASSAGRAELAEIGGLLSTSLDASDVRGARRAVVAARAWWETYGGTMAAAVRGAFAGAR